MDAGIKLENRKIKPKNSVFFDDVTDILREEGYSKFWLRFRRNMHEIFDVNEALKTRVEEMQKALEWYASDKNWGSIEELGAFVSDGGERAKQTLKWAESQ